MAFISENFSPVGGNARGGNKNFQSDPPSENSIQVFSYSTDDTESMAQSNGYFNELNEGGGGSYLRRGDWIQMAANVNGGLQHSLRFVLGDGSFPSVKGQSIGSTGGAGYVVGELVTVDFTDGTVLQKAVIEVTSINAGAVDGIRLVDPGFFLASDPPTTLTEVPTTANLSGTGFLVDIGVLAAQTSEALVTLSTLAIVQV